MSTIGSQRDAGTFSLSPLNPFNGAKPSVSQPESLGSNRPITKENEEERFSRTRRENTPGLCYHTGLAGLSGFVIDRSGRLRLRYFAFVSVIGSQPHVTQGCSEGQGVTPVQAPL